ncbi:MAG: 4-alpha-glucanotransferase, partial [Myxococcales bacterium]|nr:4-alpha-glucanotransferase [Myxococcales bacterium]
MDGLPTPADDPLHRLAREHGLELRYIDIAGKTQHASPEVLRAVLRGMGVVLESDADVTEQLARARKARWSRPLEPVIVAWEGEGSFSVHLPARLDRGRFSLTLTPEDGETRSIHGRLEDHPPVAQDELDGERWVARQLTLPGPLPHGYHRMELTVAGSGIRGEAVVMSAPLRAYAPEGYDQARLWGVFLPLYALHGERSVGAGNLGDLRALMGWVAERGGSVVGTLPLLAAFLDEPFEPSPYAPASRLAWNELFVHLEGTPEYAASPRARELYEGAQAQPLRARLRDAPLVEYREQMAFERRALEALAETCFAAGSARREAVEQFARERPEIDDYARFRAVTDRHRVVWPQWPQALRDGTVGPDDYDPAHYRYHLYAQFAMHEQLTTLRDEAPAGSLGLYLDLPIGVNGCGYDTWRHGDLYMRTLSTGAPPDTLFGGGQNWAFPPLHPERLREQGYRHLIAILRNHFRYAGVLRID